jgi:non-specific serine/threonine protein kinase/serine/threonine-protein kinase
MASPGFWDRAQALFADAMELRPDERARFLDERCGDDAGLRAEVESLIEAEAGSDGFLAVKTRSNHREPDVLSRDDVGAVIGHFRITDKIGEGGMGVVYRAERVDDFSQRVAIKMIDAPMRNAEASRRFRVERQILANLQHPHIVGLLDGGVTSDGRAYLVMEHVDGAPITRYCAERTLALRERLRLFVDLCSAVQDAHQRAVVHRDLKPANLLVTPGGVLKVLDFGIAKLLDAPRAALQTMTDALNPLTPNYASPEQLRGLPITTASDIYALGVLLYELVAGVRPYETTGKTLDEILMAVVVDDPPRPSAARDDQGARLPYDRRALKGDLDAIVSKAMSKEPSRRYASARELADDIERHLAGRPVLAREPSFAYLAITFARRHRAAVAAAAVAIVALVTALAVSMWETRIALAERARADERFRDARQLANVLMFKIHDAVRPLAGSTPVRQQIVAEALSYLERLSRDPATDGPLRIELAKGYHRVGDVQGSPAEANLGDRAGALASYRKGTDLLRPLVASGGIQRDAALELAALQIATARIATQTGARDDAIAASREAATLASSLARQAPADDEVRRMIGRAHLELAVAIGTTSDDSLGDLARALTQFEALLAAHPGEAMRLRDVALVEKYLGAHFEENRDYDRALEHHRRAQNLDEQRLRSDPSNRLTQLDVAVDLSNVAYAHWGTGRLADAAGGYEQSLEIRRRLLESDPSDAYARSRVAYAHSRLGSVYSQLGRHRDARRHAEEAVRISEAQSAIDAAHAELLAEDLIILGQVEQRAGDSAEACRTFARARDVLRSVEAIQISTIQNDLSSLKGPLASCASGESSGRGAR